MNITKQMVINGVYGLAIGDALGVPYEFINREKIAAAPCVDMVGFGVYNKPAGTFSDDTSMALALMDGLTDIKREGDYAPIMDKFLAWLNTGAYTADGVFDVGRTCMDAIMKYSRGVHPKECGGSGEYHNGNGALMRILPAVLFTLAKHKDISYGFIDDMSSLTHGHYISKTACKIYARVVEAILSQNPIKTCIVAAVNELDVEKASPFDRLRSADFYNLPQNEVKSSGYVIDTLEAALWCFCNTLNYRDCVFLAVNLGSDTDTVAAVAGSLAGLHYGIEAIPKTWVETLRGKEMIDKIIDKFYGEITGVDDVI